tara:strand:+ start:98 stop:481 length:384 start_codon:yes stop_codon:yes gene_type:complete
MSKIKITDGLLTVFGVVVLTGALVYLASASGCSNVKGFAYADDGVLTAGQARQAAAVAQAEADALNSIANEQDRTAQGILNAVDTAASSVGAPEIVSALIGAAGALFIPPPGSRRKREQAVKDAAGE